MMRNARVEAWEHRFLLKGGLWNRDWLAPSRQGEEEEGPFGLDVIVLTAHHMNSALNPSGMSDSTH